MTKGKKKLHLKKPVKDKLRRYGIILAVLFVAITAGLTGSSWLVNTTKGQEMAAQVTGKTIVKATDPQQLEQTLQEHNVSYKQLYDTTYVIDGSQTNADDLLLASAAVDDYEDVQIENEIVFEISGHSKQKKLTKVKELEEEIPESTTLRQLADERGQKLVAIIDTGVNDYAIQSVNFTEADSKYDINGHGTAVAEMINEESDGKVMILSLKALDDDGTGSMSRVMEAIQYAREQHVDIINLSIAAYDTGSTDIFSDLVKEAINDGITVVAAAGNYNMSAGNFIPANIEGVISVGAIDKDGNKAETSNYGASYYEEADSTSIAAAKLTGKLAAGDDLSNEKTGSDIVMNLPGQVDPEKDVLLRPTEVRESNSLLGENHQYSVDYNINMSSVIQRQILMSDAKYILTSVMDLSEIIGGDVPEYYDKAYGGYHYTFESEDDFKKALNQVSDADVGFYYGDKVSRFAVQWSQTSVSLAGPTANYAGYGQRTGHITVTLTVNTNGDGTVSWSVTIDSDGFVGIEFGANEYVNITASGGGISGTKTWHKKDATLSYGGGNTAWGTAKSATVGSDSFTDYRTSSTTYTFTVQLIGTWSNQLGTMLIFTPTVTPGCTHGGGYSAWKGNGTNTHYRTCNRCGNIVISHTANTSGTVTVTKFPTCTTTGTRQYQCNGGDGFVTKTETIAALGHAYGDWSAYTAYSDTQDRRQRVCSRDSSHIDYSYRNVISYSIHFDSNLTADGRGTGEGGGTMSDQAVLHLRSYNLTANAFYRTGYTFKSWNTKADGTGTSYGDQQSVQDLNGDSSSTSAITLYAIWVPNKYTVVYNKNGDYYLRNGVVKSTPSDAAELPGGTMSNKTETYDDAFNLDAVKYTWAGHTFLGWAASPDAASAEYTDGEEVNNLTAENNGTFNLYAVWSADARTLTIDPVSGEGTWKGNTDAVTESSDKYWGDYYDVGKADPVDKTAVITYDTQAGDAVIDRTTDTVNWLFNKWTMNKGHKGVLFNNDAGGSDDTRYLIQSTDDTLTANYYFSTVTLPTPTREGYTFLGWYTDASTTHKAGNGGQTYRTNETETLYARWTKDSLTYEDTVEAFMQNDYEDSTDLYFRKIDSLTKEPITTVGGRTTSAKIGIYKDSVSDANLLLTVDTGAGIYNAAGTQLAGIDAADANGWYDLSAYLSNSGNTYVAHEIAVPTGYFAAHDITFTYDGTKKVQISMEDKHFSSPVEFHLSKQDTHGRNIAGAVFTLHDNTANADICTLTSNEDGILTADAAHNSVMNIANLLDAGHTYEVRETTPPEGFKAITAAVTFTAPMYEDDEPLTPITITDEVKQAAELRVLKVDSDDNPLEGSTFALYMKDSSGTLKQCYMNADTHEWVDADEASDTVTPMVITTGSDGIAVFKNLPLRANYTGSESDVTKYYYLKETSAPEGYNVLPYMMDILLPDDGNTVFTYTVKDDSVILTLEAGGNGMLKYACFGSALIAIAVMITAVVRRRKEESTE